MVPLLAPLLGSLAGSLLPATVGTGIAGALGLKGAAAGLVAAAAPKAIGAGIGTLLAGGDLGDAALNAVGFGAAGAAGSALSGGLSGAAGVGSAAPATAAAAPAAAAPPPVVPTEAAASAINPQDMFRTGQQLAQAFGGGQQQAAPQMAPVSTQPAQPRRRASENLMLEGMMQAPPSPMLASAPSPAVPSVGGSSMLASAPSPAVPSVGGSSMMPPAVGIGTIPMGGQQPMSNDMMLAGMSPNQSNMVNQYLRSRNMVGFA